MKHLAGSSRLLRAINERAALGLLLERGPLTRGDLRELTGLAKPTTSEVLRRLEEAGLARVVGRTSGGPGPNAEVYAVNPDAAYGAAVSVREHDNSVVTSLCDLTGEVRARIEVEVDFSQADPVQAVADAVQVACEHAGVPLQRLGHVQLGVPGSYDETADEIHHIDVPGWSRPGLIGEIRRRLETEVSVDNDVNLAATAERAHGIAADADSFALLWLGEEGLGLAIYIGGALLRGARGGAGEIGYMPVGLPGPPEAGASSGVHDFQDLVGGEAVRELARQYGFTTSGGLGHTAVAAAVAGLDNDDPAKPREFLDALASRIAVGLAAVIAVLDPALVVLAGEVGQAGGVALRDAVTAALRDLSVLQTAVAATSLEDDAVLLGALDASLTAVRGELLGSTHPDRGGGQHHSLTEPRLATGSDR